MPVAHAFSVDVEDWTSGVLSMWFGKDVSPEAGVVDNSLRMLELLETHDAKATWFFLGDVAEAYPQLVRRVAEAGHRLGVHGWKHTPVWDQSPAEFRANVVRARNAVEQAGGAGVLGHRAPTFSIGASTPWAFEILVESGFAYDSSVFPFGGGRYGDPTAPIAPWTIDTRSGPLIEIPLSVIPVLGRRLPVCGGGYLRHFPVAVTMTALRRLSTEGRRAIFFVHPYELETSYRAEPFRLPISVAKAARYWLWRKLQYRNRRCTKAKLERVLEEFPFRAIEDVVGLLKPQANGGGVRSDG